MERASNVCAGACDEIVESLAFAKHQTGLFDDLNAYLCGYDGLTAAVENGNT